MNQLLGDIDLSHYFVYKERFERDLAKSIERLSPKNRLRDACEYALMSGGKRLRAVLILMIADAIAEKSGVHLDVGPVALSSEYSHTASLIVDDLPCMDDESERRDKPCTHLVFGETVTLLASYALITNGFEKIHENYELMLQSPKPYCDRAAEVCANLLKITSSCSGILGATGGQFIDIFPENFGIDGIFDLIYKKTVTLFESAFTAGWLFGGGDPSLLGDVKKGAYHFGMAFQIADDIGDIEQDRKSKSATNIAIVLGTTKACALYRSKIDLALESIQSLGIASPAIISVFQMVEKMAESNIKKALV